MRELTDKSCEGCGGPVYSVVREDGRPRKRRLCSAHCGRYRRTQAEINAEAARRRTATCQGCGIVFVAGGVDRMKYCSRACASASRFPSKPEGTRRERAAAGQRKTRRTCRFCRRRFRTTVAATKRECSEECRGKRQSARSRQRHQARNPNPRQYRMRATLTRWCATCAACPSRASAAARRSSASATP